MVGDETDEQDVGDDATIGIRGDQQQRGFYFQLIFIAWV